MADNNPLKSASRESLEIALKKMSGKTNIDLSSYSRDALEIAVDKIGQKHKEESIQMHEGKALRTGLESGVLLGFRPFIAGLAGGAGKAVSRLEAGMGLKEAIKAGKEGFSKERERSNLEEKVAGEKFPGITTASEVAGAILTAPLTPIRTLKGAALLGGATGLGSGLSKKDDIESIAGEAVKGAILGGVTQKAFEVAGKTIEKVSNSEIGQKVLEKSKNVAAKFMNLLSGVPDQEIKTLMEEGDEVAGIIKRSGGDLTGEADKLRQGITNGIQKTRTDQNKVIEQVLEEFPKDRFIPTDEILIKMRDIRNKVDSRINPESTKAINNLMKIVENVSDDAGNINFKELYDLKRKFQDLSGNTFAGKFGIFPNPKDVQRAGKEGYKITTELLNTFSPELKAANQTLSKLHAIEDKINMNLIKPGTPDNAIFAVGAGTNKRNVNFMKALENVTGKEIVSEAQKLSAARAFSSPSLSSADTTGKGVERLAKGAVVGGAIGGAIGGPAGATIGAAVGTLATSPAAVKAAIRSGQVSVKIAKEIYKNAEPKVKSLLIQEFGRINLEGK